jgi:hypothetical protein
MATENSKTIKATRATISIGDITLNVYQLPDGSYRLSGRNVTDAVGEEPNGLARVFGVRSIKDLPILKSQSGTPGKEKAMKPAQGKGSERYIDRRKINPGKEGSPFWELMIEEAVVYWAAVAGKGNKSALALIAALAIETVERRADRVFGVQVEEQERDDRLKVRIKTIKVRLDFTQEVKEYVETHSELSEGKRRWMYRNATDRLYRVVIGCDAAKLREIHNLDPDANIREWLHQSGNSDALEIISAIERLAALKVRRGMSPNDAVDMAMSGYEELSHLMQPLPKTA